MGDGDKDKNILNDGFDRLRTGKTGVAFGLLRCRKGGKDVKIINKNVDERDELLFPYFLGSLNERGCFKVDIDARVDYGVWTYFTYTGTTRTKGAYEGCRGTHGSLYDRR